MIHLTKIIAAVLLLLALALGSYAWMLGRQQPAQPAAAASAMPAPAASKLYPVVVTTKPVPAGEVIAADSLRVAQLPLQINGGFSETSVAAGRVPVTDLAEGTPLQESQLVSGLALRLANGERAMAVKADEVMGVGNRVQAGDFVDVFVTFKTDGKEIDRSQARLLLARKRVLAFGNASVDGGPAKGGDGKASSSANRVEAARTVVLAVPVEDVNRLSLGEASGRLLLALRNPADLAEPDPALLAVLPPAASLAPLKPGQGPRKPLEGMDKAQGGLAVADMVGSSPMQGQAAMGLYRAAPQAGQRPVSASGRPAASRGLEVEIIRGDRRETISY